VTKAYLLANPSKALTVDGGSDGKVVSLPSASPTPYAGVVVLELPGKPEVIATASRIRPASDGTLVLKAADAELVGNSIRVESKSGGDPSIGFWTNAKDYVQWPVLLTKAGSYDVEATFACAPGSEGSEVELTIGDQSYPATVVATQGWDDFVTRQVGTIEISKTGSVDFVLKATQMPSGVVVNLRKLEFKPAN
jgi:alpha-L-fucosidase